MKVGSLVRYKHDKTSMGLVVALLPERGGDTILVQWQTRKGRGGRSRWCVRPEYIEVKGASRYGWRDV